MIDVLLKKPKNLKILNTTSSLEIMGFQRTLQKFKLWKKKVNIKKNLKYSKKNEHQLSNLILMHQTTAIRLLKSGRRYGDAMITKNKKFMELLQIVCQFIIKEIKYRTFMQVGKVF